MLKIKTIDTRVELTYKETTPIEILTTISSLYECLMKNGVSFQEISKIIKKTQKVYHLKKESESEKNGK